MENDNKLNKEEYNMSFFKKIIYSIIKFEKYPEMAALGVKRALLYLIELIMIFSIIFTIVFIKSIKIKNDFVQDNMTLREQMLTIIEKNNNINPKEALQYFTNENEVSDLTVLISIYISVLILIFLATLIDIIMLSGFGLMTCFMAKIKINYKAIFNMSIYALTLPIILKIIYFAIIMLTNLTIKYFYTMYIAIAYISLAAAIFLIKSNIIKQHIELMKIIEEGKEKIEDSMLNLKRDKDKQQEENDEKESNDKNKEKKKNTESEEQGSNA